MKITDNCLLKGHILILLFILLCSGSLFAQTISGKSQAYAGKNISFYTYTDPVTQEKNNLFTLNFNSEGDFSTELKVDETIFAFAEFGIYRGLLFIEPGRDIEILMPPVREKSFADSKNPYFRPVEFWFSTKSGTALNDNISEFDSRLNGLTDKYFNSLYFNNSREVFDTIQITLAEHFSEIKNLVFEQHKKLQLAAVEADAFRLEPKKVSGLFQTINLQYMNHPAFIRLFEKTYENRLSFEVRTLEGSAVRKMIESGNAAALKALIKEKYLINGTVADAALMKMLHDAFYSGDFNRNDIIRIAGTAHFQQHPEKIIRNLSKNILEKLQFLGRGNPAPVVCLKNTDGHSVCSDKISDDEKYKYLLFADTEMMICREHLKYLSEIEKQFQKYLEIIIVLRKTNLIEMKIFLDKENVPGIHLVDDADEYAGKYRVKSYPSAFLLDSSHNVVFQQAKSPLDGFEHQFAPFLRQELFERQRNQVQ